MAEKASKGSGSVKVMAALGGLTGAAIFVAVITGFFGWGVAHLRAQVYPRDESLLEHLPEETSALAIIDPHQADLSAMGGQEGALGKQLARVRTDIKNVMGIDLAWDVDKLVLSPSLVVARGRFSHDALAKKLGEARYVAADYKGAKMLVRKGEDAVMVASDGTLLYGDEAALRDSIDARAAGKTLAGRAKVVEHLAQVGWAHPFVGTLQLTDEKPSIKAAVTGSTAPRAYTIALDTRAGVDVLAYVEAASVATAEETARLLEERRRDPGSLAALARGDLLERVGAVAKQAKIAVLPGTANVVVQVHLDAQTIDGLSKAWQKGLPEGLWKDVRLLQLLAPL